MAVARSLRASGAILLLLAAAFVATPALARAQQATPDTRPGIAVLPFDYGGSYGKEKEDFDALKVGLQQMLLTELAQNDSLRIVERTKLRDLMQEQDLGSSGRVDAETAARIGKLVGARYVVTGSFTDLFGEVRMDARIVDGETSEVLKTESVRDKREKMYDMLVRLASQVTAGVDLPPLAVAKRQARQKREIPAEAVTLYSRAQVFQDGGQKEQAIELYRRIVDRFPQMTEAKAALRQLTAG